MTTDKDRGIRSSNREFVRYDQVDKSHTYRLADSGQDEFDEDFKPAPTRSHEKSTAPRAEATQ